MKKSIAVLGLGKFGRSLARSLSSLGADVLAVDQNETIVKEIADFCSEAVCADLTNEESLNALGLKERELAAFRGGDSDAETPLDILIAVSDEPQPGTPAIIPAYCIHERGRFI